MGEKIWEKANPSAEERRSTPKKVIWFQNHNKTPIKVASGNSWALIQAKDNESGALELYGWCESAKDGRFGKNTKDVYGEKFVMLGNQINHNDVQAFACSREATFVVLAKNVEQLPSVHPE
jgi:hypothetical protein